MLSLTPVLLLSFPLKKKKKSLLLELVSTASNGWSFFWQSITNRDEKCDSVTAVGEIRANSSLCVVLSWLAISLFSTAKLTRHVNKLIICFLSIQCNRRASNILNEELPVHQMNCLMLCTKRGHARRPACLWEDPDKADCGLLLCCQNLTWLAGASWTSHFFC